MVFAAGCQDACQDACQAAIGMTMTMFARARETTVSLQTLQADKDNAMNPVVGVTLPILKEE